MKLIIEPGAVDVSLLVFIQDSASTTGGGKTGLAYNTASLTAYYARPGATPAAITLATQTVTGAHSDGGFVEVDATNMPGVYRLDLPDAVVASGVRAAVVMLKGASGMAPLTLEIDMGAGAIDGLLKRDMSAVTGESARSPLNALRFLRNRKAVSGVTLNVYKEDDTTVSWSATLTTSASAEPIIDFDPG